MPTPGRPTCNPDEDETFRVSATLAADDAAAAVSTDGLSAAAATRLRRIVARIAHVLVLRRAFAAAEFERHAGRILAQLDATDRDGPARPPVRPIRRPRRD